MNFDPKAFDGGDGKNRNRSQNRNRTGRKKKLGWNSNMVNNWIGLDSTELSLNSVELTSIFIN